MLRHSPNNGTLRLPNGGDVPAFGILLYLVIEWQCNNFILYSLCFHGVSALPYCFLNDDSVIKYSVYSHTL